MMSAVARMVRSSTFSAKWFQEFQPMGGVPARDACAGSERPPIAPSSRSKEAEQPFSW